MTTHVLLGLSQLIGLSMIALGRPGVWVQLVVLAAFGWWTGFTQVGVVPLLILLVLAAVGELLVSLAGRSELEKDLDRKVASGGVAGGVVGGLIGLRYPLLGTIAGAFIGAWVGASLAGWRVRSRVGGRARVGPRITAAAMRASVGIAIAAFTLLILIF